MRATVNAGLAFGRHKVYDASSFLLQVYFFGLVIPATLLSAQVRHLRSGIKIFANRISPSAKSPRTTRDTSVVGKAPSTKILPTYCRFFGLGRARLASFRCPFRCLIFHAPPFLCRRPFTMMILSPVPTMQEPSLSRAGRRHWPHYFSTSGRRQTIV